MITACAYEWQSNLQHQHWNLETAVFRSFPFQCKTAEGPEENPLNWLQTGFLKNAILLVRQTPLTDSHLRYTVQIHRIHRLREWVALKLWEWPFFWHSFSSLTRRQRQVLLKTDLYSSVKMLAQTPWLWGRIGQPWYEKYISANLVRIFHLTYNFTS